jgi:uncharacterized protein
VSAQRRTPTRFTGVIASVDDLANHYRPPTERTANKKLDHLPPWIRATIEASRFAFVATATAEGAVTVSPRGGEDGFVVTLDDHTLALPDYPGNNLTDSLRNVIANRRAGLLLMVPGRPETIRVDGDAWVVTDREVLEACRLSGGRQPKTAMVLEVRAAFFHCPASFQRADLWNPETWRADASLAYDAFIRQTLDPSDWPEWAHNSDEDEA